MKNHPQYSQSAMEFFDSVARGQLSRREVLRRAAVLGISTPVLASLLAACADDTDDDIAAPDDDPDEAPDDDPDEVPDDDPDEAPDDDPDEVPDDDPDEAPDDDPDEAPDTQERRTVVVGAWAGTFSDVLRDVIAPILDEEDNVELLVEEGVSGDQLAKMRVGRDNPEHTCMFIDDNIIDIAHQEDLIEQLSEDEIPNLAEVYPEFILTDSHGVGVAVSWIEPYYNTERIDEPTSYEDWWNPDYAGRVAVPDISISPGVQFLIMAASLGTGLPPEEAQYEIDAGFEKLAELRGDAHSFYTSFNNITPPLADGEVCLAFGHSRIANGWVLRDAPMARAMVEEGPFAGINAVALVKNGPHQDIGKKLINLYLSEEIQTQVVELAHAGSVNQNVEPPEELEGLVPHGPEDVAAMINIDWEHANENREEWAERFSREITG